MPLAATPPPVSRGDLGVAESLHVNLDDAWPAAVFGPAADLDARAWGPRLRYCARTREMQTFGELLRSRPSRFVLWGSGDFHHLTTLRLAEMRERITLLSFDNHPDWDIRPPRWCCGTWISRALESPLLERAFIWGCGNFELDRPGSFFANHRGLRSGRLTARPWAERLRPASRARWPVVSRAAWREEFASFAGTLRGCDLYLTVDLDCLAAPECAANWENGLFTADEVAWALREVRRHAHVVAGDVCGAASEPHFARPFQRLAAAFDRPKLPPVDGPSARERNLRALHTIWPALTGADFPTPSARSGTSPA